MFISYLSIYWFVDSLINLLIFPSPFTSFSFLFSSFPFPSLFFPLPFSFFLSSHPFSSLLSLPSPFLLLSLLFHPLHSLHPPPLLYLLPSSPLPTNPLFLTPFNTHPQNLPRAPARSCALKIWIAGKRQGSMHGFEVVPPSSYPVLSCLVLP